MCKLSLVEGQWYCNTDYVVWHNILQIEYNNQKGSLTKIYQDLWTSKIKWKTTGCYGNSKISLIDLIII